MTGGAGVVSGEPRTPSVRRNGVRRLARPGPGLVVVVAAYLYGTYVLANASAYNQSLFTVAAVFAILAVSLDLVAGVTGLYSLGHAGLFALGAYGTTLMANDHGWSTWALLPVCVLGVGVVGLLIGSLALRVSGLYFAITTFIFTLLVAALLADFRFTGGLGGVIGPLFPDFSPGLEWLGSSLVWATMISLLVATAISYAIRRSPFYAVLLAIRDAEPFAAAAGARTAAIKIAVFGLSAAMAGLAGWVFSFQGTISPGQFSWTVSVNILVMVILGGINSLTGPILGAAFISIFPAYVNINPFWQEVLFGALLLLFIVLAPRGFIGILTGIARWVGGRVGLIAPTGRRRPAEAGAGDVPPAEATLEDVRQLLRTDGEGTRGGGGGTSAAAAVRDAPAIECRGLVFSYGEGVRALDEVDFIAKRGTIHGLIGPNGSGKSTLVDLIAGRIKPQAGTVAVQGERLERHSAPSRARHGLMRTFQTAVLVDDLSCAENVTVGLYSRVPRVGARAALWPVLPTARRDGRRMAGSAQRALGTTGVNAWRDIRVGDVPHGVEQLTQLAWACVAGPNTLVLDEPLAGLSSRETERVKVLLHQLRDAGVTILLIEHQPRFVFSVCDEVTVLNAGQVVASGPAAEVRQDTKVREVYLGQ